MVEKEGDTTESQPDPAPPEKEPGKPKKMMDDILTEVKAVRTCVGDECKKIREEFRAKLSKMEPGTLTDAQLKAITHDLHEKIGGELESSFEKRIAGLNVRTGQYGNKMDEAAESVRGHTDEVKQAVETLKDMERARVERAAAEAEVSAKADPPLAPTVDECPNCNYKDLTVKPKISMGCPTCKVGFTTYETDPVKDDGTGGQGYKFCSTCGIPLVPATDLVAAAKKAKKDKKATPPPS